MSAWRRRAIETLPDMRREFEDPEMTIYQVLFEMLARVENEADRKDEKEPERIFDYALWCHTNRDREITNAVGVAFYEHLADEPHLRDMIVHRLPPNVFEDCRSLFELRLTPPEFKELCERYARRDEPPPPPNSYPCPVCGYYVFDYPPGSYALCPICWWEDDLVQLSFPLMEGGANTPSLYAAQQEFLRSGSSDAACIDQVRKPEAADRRDPEWRPFDPDRDPRLDWNSKKDLEPYRAGGNRGVYYWRDDYWLLNRKRK